MTAPSNPTAPLRLLAVHAHPDDESSKGAATMAMYAAAGVEVMVATCTDGSRGDIQNPAMEDAPHPKRDMAGARRLEMANAAAVLGIRQRWLGFVDSGPAGRRPAAAAAGRAPSPPCRWSTPRPRWSAWCVPSSPMSSSATTRTAATRTRTTSWPTRLQWKPSKLPGTPSRYPEAGPAWEPSKLYYDRAFSPDRFRALHFALEEAGLQSPYAERLAAWLETDAEGHTPPATVHTTTTQVDCGDFFEARDDALRAHRTQIDPLGFFFAVSTEMQRKAWPWEDYCLIQSRVPSELPEKDLFAGLR